MKKQTSLSSTEWKPDNNYVVQHDKWDKNLANKLIREMREYQMAKEDLRAVVSTGNEAMTDTLWALVKFGVVIRDKDQIRPSYLVNQHVLNQLVELDSYQQLRRGSKGDPISAALAAIELKPELIELFKTLENEQEKADALEDMLAEKEHAEHTLESVLSGLGAGEGGDDEIDAESLQAIIQRLSGQIEDATEELDGLLTALDPKIRDILGEGMDRALENEQRLRHFSSWGLEPGAIRKMDPSVRIELSRKLESEKFKKMAEIIGRVQRIAWVKDELEISDGNEEIFSIEAGNTLARALPIEVLLLLDESEELYLNQMRKYMERSWQQYAYQSHDRKDRGGIIYIEDGSSTMAGDRTMWAKAIGIALLKIAVQQGRSFRAIQFGRHDQHVTFDFKIDNKDLSLEVTTQRSGAVPVVTGPFHGAQAVVEYADVFLSGGTDFETPLRMGLDWLREEFLDTGRTSADIVFATDGLAPIEAVREDFLEEQERLGFQMFGIPILTDANKPIFTELCTGGVTSVQNLMDLDNLDTMFAEVRRR